MIWHVYPTVGRRDAFRPDRFRDGDRELRVPIESPGTPQEVRTHRMWRVIDAHHLKIHDVATELYRSAVAVYTADLRIPRRDADF